MRPFHREEECDVKHCDVLVIGGGIIGCSIAYYVSKYGRDVTIIEKGNLLVARLHDVTAIFWRLIKTRVLIVRCRCLVRN
ncbi:FAD-dependent oxidoreductase [Bacillus sp. S14(2024)]|uniref:FAD-dependent oxidoreductase n=1 Tax=Bacillus sp. S14(2024) TaxID=3162884 RepID=UPI003D2368F0